MSVDLRPTPMARTAAMLLTMGVAYGAREAGSLALLWGCCLLVLWRQGEWRAAVDFLWRLWLPLAAGLFVVWGFAIRGTPETMPGSSMVDGLRYATVVSLRLAALAALFQAAFVSLRGLRLIRYLSQLGFSPNVVASLASVFNLWPDFARYTHQVVAARCARGLMTDRRLLTRLRQVPVAFRTLFLSTLQANMERAHRWQAEQIPERLVAAARLQGSAGTRTGSVFWVGLAFLWCAYALYGQRFFPTR